LHTTAKKKLDGSAHLSVLGLYDPAKRILKRLEKMGVVSRVNKKEFTVKQITPALPPVELK